MSSTTTEEAAATTTIELRSASEATPAPQSNQEDTQSSYPHGVRLVAITVALVLSIFLSALDSTIIATLIPALTAVFGSLNLVGWYGSSYAMANAAFLSLWGKAYSFFPLKVIFLCAIALFELGNLISGAAQNSASLIAGRAIAGAGGSGVMTGCFIIIAFTSKPEWRAMYMAVLGVTFGIASVAGPLLGGAVVDTISWRWGFWLNLPIGIFAGGMMMIFFKTPAAARPRSATLKEKLIHMDPLGTLLVLAAIACFILSMHYVGTIKGFSSIPAIGYFIGFLCLTALFIVNEYQMGESAMLQLSFFRRRRFVENLIFMFFFAGLYFSLVFSLPIQFQSVNDLNASSSGLRLIPLVLGVSIFTMVSNFILTRFHKNLPLLLTGSLLSLLGSILVYILTSAPSTTVWIIIESLTASGVGLALQLPMIANQASVANSEIATATSITLFFETVGQALFVAASEAALTNRLINNIAKAGHDLDPQLVIAAGATGFRTVFKKEEEVGEIVKSYLVGLKASHLISLVCGTIAAGIAGVMAFSAMRIRVRRGETE